MATFILYTETYAIYNKTISDLGTSAPGASLGILNAVRNSPISFIARHFPSQFGIGTFELPAEATTAVNMHSKRSSCFPIVRDDDSRKTTADQSELPPVRMAAYLSSPEGRTKQHKTYR